MKRHKKWEFLWLEYERVGYSEEYRLFGYRFYRRCGAVVEWFGKERIEKQ